jgi:hypothetical protein
MEHKRTVFKDIDVQYCEAVLSHTEPCENTEFSCACRSCEKPLFIEGYLEEHECPKTNGVLKEPLSNTIYYSLG